MTLDEPLRLVHHHPGRLRARARVFVDATEDHPAVVEARSTAAAAQIRRFTHSPATGSILIEYSPGGIDPDQLLERIAANVGLSGVVSELATDGHREALVDAVLDTCAMLNDLAREATNGRADLRELLPGALAAAAAISFISGGGGVGRMPRWEVLLWYAQVLFSQWHGDAIARRSRANAEEKNERSR
jgi:hypothetical protein